MATEAYIGRFAPSPTGPLHFGSLVAAVASFLEAKTKQGQWLVRMEDLDKPREIAGAADAILHTLEAFGFEWDGPVVYQSQQGEAYATALDALLQADLVYACACTRREIADSATHGIDGMVYPGTCRRGLAPGKQKRAWRIRAEASIGFNDAIQGYISQNLAEDIGDFVLKRADGLFAYQLAVVVDDARQGVKHVVRGADLLDSTPRQIYLQQALGYLQPSYAHIPVVTNAQGEKLSKQTLAQAINIKDARQTLWHALHFLGQNPPPALLGVNLTTLWDWSANHWDLNAVPHIRATNPATDISQH